MGKQLDNGASRHGAASVVIGLWCFVRGATLSAAPPGLGNVTQVNISGTTLMLSIGPDRLVLQPCSPKIVRIEYRRNQQTDPETPTIDPGHIWPGDPTASIDASASPIVLRTAGLSVKVDRAPCRLSLFDAAGQLLLWEQSAGGVFVDAPSDEKGGLRFNHAPGQNLYGIKAYDRDTGHMGLLRNGDNTSNQTYQINAATQGGAGAPFLWTTSGYGLVVDTDNGYMVVDANRVEFYYGSPPTGSNGRRYDRNNTVEFYLFVGKPKELLAAASQITGQAPLFPRWAMGFTNSQWGIDQHQLLSIVDQYRAKDVPLDNYTLDFDWKAWGQDNYGEFRWNTANFPGVNQAAGQPSFKSLMDANGVKLTGIMKPRIVRCPTQGLDQLATMQAKDAQTNGYWYPTLDKHIDYFSQLYVGELDFSNPKCRAWFWNNIKIHDAFQGGIVGFWNDEADEADLGNMQHAVFNNFEHFHMQQALYEGLRMAYPSPSKTPRMWSISRNFYLGAQRYAYGMWSGDINADFGTMKLQSERLLATVALGQSKWGMDSGGFSNNPSPENYARWLQFSAFVPVFRVHGEQFKLRQPWVYGQTAEEVASHAIRCRYRLAPYIYAYERTAFEQGVGLVRPLMIEFPDDPQSADQVNEWMFGDWLLVAPVLDPQITQTTGQSALHPVYLPPGTWIDFFRGDERPGGQTIQYALNPGVWTDIPLLIRRGAIIASQDVVPSLGSNRPSRMFLDIFPDSQETTATVYDDDGQTYGYEEGAIFKQSISTHEQAATTTLLVAAKKGSYVPSQTFYVARLHGRAATAVTLNGVQFPKLGNLEALNATPAGWTTGRDVYGPVTHIKTAFGQAADQRFQLTGNEADLPTSQRYEAENMTLFGLTPTSRAHVNNNHSGYTGTGFVDGIDQPGAGLKCELKLKSAGDYLVSLRLANGSAAEQTLSLYVNGFRWGPLTVAPTANWDAWADMIVPLELAAGNNILTFKHDITDSARVNFDALTVPLDPVSIVSEAEDAVLSGGSRVNVNHRHYTGTGFVDGLTATGATATVTVYAPIAGDYVVTPRYSNGNGADRTLSLLVNGARLKSITLPATADWESWNTVSETVSLPVGMNSLGFSFAAADDGQVNLDRVTVTPAGRSPPEVRVNLVDNGGFEAGIAGWQESHTVGPLGFGVDSGNALGTPEYPTFGNQRAYLYCPSAFAEQITQHVTAPMGGALYRLEAWTRCANNTPSTATVQVQGYGAAPLNVSLLPADGQWRLVQIEHIPVTTGHVDIVFSVDSPGGTTLQIDEVRFTRE